jgi:predicted ATPase/transcriptional regulator with XRE-family HTH domain
VGEEERSAGSSGFGPLLRRHRLAVGLSQEALAERAGMSTQGIGALERGDRRTPQRKTLELLAAVLRLDPEQSRTFAAAAARPNLMRPGDGRSAARPAPPDAGAAAPNNLPRHLTTFIGRREVVAEVAAFVERARLVTLVGSAGVGKTRTSLEAGELLLERFADGVWLIELAPLASGEYLPATIAQAVGLSLTGAGDPLARIAAELKRKRALLIFDNCEHLVEAVARVVAALLTSCPEIRILASTRQSLGIAGEAMYRLPSLPVPDPSAVLTVSEAGRYPSLALFLERAADADSTFSAGDESIAAIAEICRRLDGIPLAIELAAARVRMLSPHQLRDRLNERFRLLRGGNRDRLERHQTLRAAIDWSYDLLDDRERLFFARLAIFAGGFTLEGAVAVGSCDGDIDEFEVIDLLASLVDKSLVMPGPAGDALRRYRMLESTRAYAREKLATAGEEGDAKARHLRYVRDLFVTARMRHAQTGREAEVESAFSTELDDVRAALDYAEASSHASLGAELLAAIRGTWECIGLEREGIARLERFIALSSRGDPAMLAVLWRDLANLAFNDGQGSMSLEAATEAVRFARVSGDDETLASTLPQYAAAVTLSSRFEEAEAALAEAETLVTAQNLTIRLSLLEARAFLSMYSGNLERAAPMYEELHHRQSTLGNSRKARNHALNLAEIEHTLGRTEHAVATVQRELVGVRAGRDRGTLLMLLSNLAGYLVALDRRAEALAAAAEVLRVGSAHDPGHLHVTIAIEPLALARALEGEPRTAALLAGYTEAAVQRLGFEREFTEQTTRSRLDRTLREHWSPDELRELLARGEALTTNEALALALDP